MGKKKGIKQKGKKERKPSVSSKKYAFYQIKALNVKKTRGECPKCGVGVFMAEHEDRFHCGKCGFTEFKKT